MKFFNPANNFKDNYENGTGATYRQRFYGGE